MKADFGDFKELVLLLWSKEQVAKAIKDDQLKSLEVMSILLLGLRYID